MFDPQASKVISAAIQKSAIDYNVFEGFTVKGLARYPLSRGRVVWGPDGGSPQPGHGAHVRRPVNPPVSRALSTWCALTAPRPMHRDPDLMPIGV